MTTIYDERDADLDVLGDERVADAGYPTLTRLKEQHAGPAVRAYEADLRRRLGPNAVTD